MASGRERGSPICTAIDNLNVRGTKDVREDAGRECADQHEGKVRIELEEVRVHGEERAKRAQARNQFALEVAGAQLRRSHELQRARVECRVECWLRAVESVAEFSRGGVRLELNG